MGACKHQYLHWLRRQLPRGRHSLTDLKLAYPEVTPTRDRMAAPLRLASWVRFETAMDQREWSTAIDTLVPAIHLPDEALLQLLGRCVPDQGERTSAPHYTASHPQPSRGRQHSLCGSPLANGDNATRTQNHCIGDPLLLPSLLPLRRRRCPSTKSALAFCAAGDGRYPKVLSPGHRNRHEAVHCCSYR